jgi:hypothetical protein
MQQTDFASFCVQWQHDWLTRHILWVGSILLDDDVKEVQDKFALAYVEDKGEVLTCKSSNSKSIVRAGFEYKQTNPYPQ